MSGVSVFNLFNFSIAMATFEGENTANGSLLLQVSGMRLTYNTRLTGSRLISIEIHDEESNTFLPVERLKLYTFATDSFMCTGNKPFVDFLNSRLVFPGEIPGQLDASIIHQEIVAQYLQNLEEIYEPTTTGRMFNNTEARNVLNLVQTEDSCQNNEFWNPQDFSCIECPQSSGVVFLKSELSFVGEVGEIPPSNLTISLVNTLSHNVTVISRSLPFWAQVAPVDGSTNFSDRIQLNDLETGAEVILRIKVDIESLSPGTATGSAVFGVLNENKFPGCTRPDATIVLTAQIEPTEDLNQLGSVRYFGWIAAAIVILSCIAMTTWVVLKRNTRIVRTLQPLFLVMISMGVLVMKLLNSFGI